MTPTFADRLDYAPARAARLARRAGARRLAARARLARRICTAPAAGDTAPAALPRALRAPWTGGYVALARAAGIDRIEPGFAPQLTAACFAPSSDAPPAHFAAAA